jgi:hypothetical protein
MDMKKLICDFEILFPFLSTSKKFRSKKVSATIIPILGSPRMLEPEWLPHLRAGASYILETARPKYLH